jgi:hypothetical protein
MASPAIAVLVVTREGPSLLSYAIATASYRDDFERCRLLCASIDHFVTGSAMHYLMVEDRDVPLFSALAGPTRRIIAESDMFPGWLRSWPDPLSLGKRRIWTGAGALRRGLVPLRGWHTQQLRKLALLRHAPEDVFLYADSDAIFLKSYDLRQQRTDAGIRLYRKAGGITDALPRHVKWTNSAARLLGLPAPSFPADDYINNLPTWTRTNGQALLAYIERIAARDWISAVAADREFSEMTLYGLFVDHVLGAGSGHALTTDELSRTFWGKADIRPDTFSDMGRLLGGGQVSIGVQSFIGVPLDRLWAVFRQAADSRG